MTPSDSNSPPAPKLSDARTPILIVDDNPQFASVLRKILEGVFHYTNITTVDSVNKAFSLINAAPHQFRILFVDYRFPSGENGVQLLQRLSSAGFLKGKAAFLITSEPNLDNFKQSMAAGVVGVVAKPFDREDLRRQLEKAERILLSENIDSF
ncbi:MAG: response regulator [Deltaproteobacteria bacterium]|nr:response regulator [Deltaproteobacteria bacterium]